MFEIIRECVQSSIKSNICLCLKLRYLTLLPNSQSLGIVVPIWDQILLLSNNTDFDFHRLCNLILIAGQVPFEAIRFQYYFTKLQHFVAQNDPKFGTTYALCYRKTTRTKSLKSLTPACTRRPGDVPSRCPKGLNTQDQQKSLVGLSGNQEKNWWFKEKIAFRYNSPCITHLFLLRTW